MLKTLRTITRKIIDRLAGTSPVDLSYYRDIKITSSRGGGHGSASVSGDMPDHSSPPPSVSDVKRREEKSGGH